MGREDEESAENARARRSREAEHDTRRHLVGALHSKQTVPSLRLHSTNLSISPTDQRTDGSKQSCPPVRTIFVTGGTNESAVHTAN